MFILTTNSGSQHPSHPSYHRGSFWLCLVASTDPPDRFDTRACRAESSDLVGKRAYLRLCVCILTVLWLILLHCIMCCIIQHRQSTCIFHKKDSKQTYVSLYTGLSEGRTC